MGSQSLLTTFPFPPLLSSRLLLSSSQQTYNNWINSKKGAQYIFDGTTPPPRVVLPPLFLPATAFYSHFLCVRVCLWKTHTERKSFCVGVCLEGGKLFSRFLLSLQSHILSGTVCVCVRAVRCSRPCGESSVCSVGVVGRCFPNRPPPGHLCPCLCLKVPISFSFNSTSHLLYFVCVHAWGFF